LDRIGNIGHRVKLAGLGLATERPDLRPGRPAAPSIGARVGVRMDRFAQHPVGRPPPTSTMKAYEVLVWIALNRFIPYQNRGCLFFEDFGIRTGSPDASVLEALEARAGLLENGRFCAVCCPTNSDPDRDSFRNPIFTSQGPRILRFLRAAYRQEYDRLLTYKDAARIYRERKFEDKLMTEKLDDAWDQLRDKLAGRTLVAYGLRLGTDGYQVPGALVEEIGPMVFMHPAVRITEWNSTGADPSLPHDEISRLRLPRFGEIQLQTAGVLACWPAKSIATEPVPAPEQPRALPIGTSGASASIGESDSRDEDGMQNDPWDKAPGAWVMLADLFARIKKELNIGPEEAAMTLRGPLEGLRIRAELIGWGGPFTPNWVGPGAPAFRGLSMNDQAYRVSSDGWNMVDWTSGTLCEHRIKLLWSDVRRELRPLAWDQHVTTSKAISPSKRKPGPGAPVKYDWDAFWIEVALWTAEWNLEEQDRTRLQKHMEGWTAETMSPAPDASTIRGKLAKLYAAGRARN